MSGRRFVAAGTTKDALTSTPLDYPFEIWPACFALHNGQAERLPVASLPLDNLGDYRSIVAKLEPASIDPRRSAFNIPNPIGLLSCGSNASPRRMAEKLNSSTSSAALGVRVSTTSYVPCYGATLSYYGSVPATFAARSGSALPFLIITDATNLDAMVESETRTGNYDLYRSIEGNAAIDCEMPVYAFICRFGPLLLDGEICRLAEFQADENLGVSQRSLVGDLLERLGYDVTPDRFAEQVGDKAWWAELRGRIIDRFASSPDLEGFERLG
ncbi:hypothetical protein [Sphingobium sp. CECT 9361]|uniref:hypothetical protein n=1 Tax=Sphingobium sp. CECT 9361 TaxID=2845384 RepID=UPI001E5D603A|nr:hypothetical protein [Sphingobium sp. CECT 9361]CAH0354386.1 hypothetical protein SPH9361_02998 [Sphingobium sp. CECT 9361]